MDERDLTTFDKNVLELFTLCKEILKTDEKRNLGLNNNRKNPFLTRLERYAKTYSKTEPEEHTGYFEKIYTNNKRFILLGPQRDSWLTDSEIVITYGEDAGIKTEIKVHLSVLYNKACKIRDEIREELEGLPNSSDTTETGYPNKFLLYLYRVFRELCASENEKTKLNAHIETLEAEAGISHSKGDDPLSGLFDMTSSMVEQFTGQKFSKDQMPNQNDIGKMFNNLVNDPKTKNMIGTVMSEMKNTKNINEMATKLVGALGSTDILSNMGGASSNSTSDKIGRAHV